jgi:hypothetical protein
MIAFPSAISPLIGIDLSMTGDRSPPMMKMVTAPPAQSRERQRAVIPSVRKGPLFVIRGSVLAVTSLQVPRNQLPCFQSNRK